MNSDDIRLLGNLTDVLVSGIDRYRLDWLGRCGMGEAVVRPTSVHELSDVFKFCNREKIGVTVIGGNSGLVGSTISGKGELVVSLEKLNKIIEIDRISQTVTAEAGVILENLQTALALHGLTTPFDMGSRGSCTIGGNVATNAGGLNFIRHGPLRGHVIGLKVVLATGEVVDSMSQMWKDNSGLDIKQLFIGSEGSLGVITQVRLHSPFLPLFKGLALIHSSKPFPDSVFHLLDSAHKHVGESLSAFEFFDSEGSSLVSPLPHGIGTIRDGFFVLVEASGAAPVQDRLESFLESLSDGQMTGVLATDTKGMRNLWKYRESIPAEMARLGPNLKFDLALPPIQYYEIVEKVRSKFHEHPLIRKIIGYGHVGDGNLHLNIALRASDLSFSEEVSSFVYSHVAERGGSISAEHGIGRDKLKYISLSKSPSCIAIMKNLKSMFDPNGILNPGRTIPSV